MANKIVSVERRGSEKRAPASIELKGAGLKYRLFTDRQTTLKGHFLSMFLGGRRRPSEFWALRGVDVAIRAGEVVGVIGANGSGKSTLLRVMAGILEPSEGTISVEGAVRPLLDLSGVLNGDLTGRENTYLYSALNRIGRQETDELIPGIVEFAEIGPFFDVPLKTYSSGMIARLAFALATQRKPDILLLDEVLAVGDERFQQKSYFRMQKLIEKGSLVVIVSHNLQFVQQTCTRAILLSGGHLVADGPPADIIGRYRRSA